MHETGRVNNYTKKDPLNLLAISKINSTQNFGAILVIVVVSEHCIF